MRLFMSRFTLCGSAVALVALFLPTQLGASALATPAHGTVYRAGARAHAAHTFTLDESGSLHLISKHGFLLHERGTATGTVHGTIYVNLKIVSSSRVTVEINIYPRNGSIIGYGAASYKRQRSSAMFSGSLTIERGSGSYSHASGKGLSFSGTIQRSNEAITVHVGGRVSD
jgi:hypothetical protein